MLDTCTRVYVIQWSSLFTRFNCWIQSKKDSMSSYSFHVGLTV